MSLVSLSRKLNQILFFTIHLKKSLYKIENVALIKITNQMQRLLLLIKSIISLAYRTMALIEEHVKTFLQER